MEDKSLELDPSIHDFIHQVIDRMEKMQKDIDRLSNHFQGVACEAMTAHTRSVDAWEGVKALRGMVIRLEERKKDISSASSNDVRAEGVGPALGGGALKKVDK